MVVCFSFLLFACGGGGGGGDASSVATAPAQLVSAAPTLTLSASSNSIAYSGATTISWSSTNTSSCSSSGGGGTGTSGTFGTGALTNTANYTVTCTGSNGSITRSTTVNVAPPVVVGCSTTGATGAINLSNVPSRLTGVAPLSVFFDGAGTTATGTAKPYHDLEYRWDFGDVAGSPVSGSTWKYGARANVSSRNNAIGPLSSHVFETPGTYAVTLTVKDGANTVVNNCTRIVVLDPDVVFSGTNTVCFSTSGNFSGCPTGAARVQTSNFASAVNTYAASGKRLLFGRGEVFSAASAAKILVNGPGIIGAYGATNVAKPVFRRLSSPYDAIFSLGQNTPTLIGDWRIMDIDLDGQNLKEGYNKGIDAAGQFDQLLALRLNIRGVWRGIAASHWSLPAGRAIFDGWAIVDSTITGIVGCNSLGNYNCDWRIYLSGVRHAMQGNSLDNEDTGGSHVIRNEYLNKALIQNNYIARAGVGQHAIKLHAWKWAGGSGGNSVAGVYTQNVVISDNWIVGGINPWTVSIGPQNNVSDERVRDVIFERNYITAGTGTQIGVESSASRSTYRNNIVNLGSISDHHTGFWLSRRGVEPMPDDLNVFNNTLFSNMAGDFKGFDVVDATNVTIKNNLGYAPLSQYTIQMISGVGAGGLIVSNNTTDVQLKNTDPGWSNSTPSNPVDFKLNSNSYAAGSGATLPVFSDFFGLQRSANDLGAAIH